MRDGKRWRRGAWLAIGLLVALAVSAVASDETFCVMQHTGYFNLTGGQLIIWNPTNGSTTDPKFAFITVTVVELAGASIQKLPGGVVLDAGVAFGGGLEVNPSLTFTWEDMSDNQRTCISNQWCNSRTFYAKWLRLSGKGQGFYTITFNPCGSQ